MKQFCWYRFQIINWLGYKFDKYIQQGKNQNLYIIANFRAIVEVNTFCNTTEAISNKLIFMNFYFFFF